ncbi:MAG: hypothetical protein WCT05_07910 [Lentisphaeria bacterium]
MKTDSAQCEKTHFVDWLLDGPDWQAGYFLSEKEYDNWKRRSRTLQHQLLDSARSAGITSPDGAKGNLLPASIPGCDRSVLLENGLIPDPFYGRNMHTSSWSEKYSWAFRKCFKIPKELHSARQLRLCFKGIDYQAMFFLNDNFLGTHTGMFIPVEFEVTTLIHRESENCLAVIFEPAPDGLPNHCEKDPADFAAFHRMQCGFGWDWARKIVPTGIWDSVLLSPSNTARIKDFHWQTANEFVSLSMEMEALENWTGEVSIRLVPENFDGESFALRESLSLQHGSNSKTLKFTLENAEKWYPAGYGQPSLYKLFLTLDGITKTALVAFRDLEMRRNPGTPEGARNLTFTVNGIEIFARGANWVPIDLLPSRATDADYRELVQWAGVAHFNMFRVWGGGLIEKEAFYECCDRQGILVWQEFPHACSNYRKDAEYLALKSKEASAIIRKLRNHASTALFCGGNEVQYYGEIPDSPLYLMYENLVHRLAPGVAFHTSSPDASRPGERPHGPWNYREHAFYNSHFRNFASEIGCNAMPEVESLSRFIPDTEPVPDGQSWKYHFLNLHGAHDVRIPLQGFDATGNREWSQASMFAQADAAGYIFEHYRRQAPQASGCLFWQFNEPWPTCAWSLIDYYKTPKMALYRLACANAPRAFSIEDQSWCLGDGQLAGTLWYCSDREEFNGTLKIELWDGAGNNLFSEEMRLTLDKGVQRIQQLQYDCHNAKHGIVLVVLNATDARGLMRSERLYGVPDFKAAFRLPPATIEYSVQTTGQQLEVRLNNTGRVPALAVRAQAKQSLLWQQNYCSLAPGECLVYHAQASASTPVAEEITLSGWNLPNNNIVRNER